MSRPALARNTFEPRPPPARNLYDHVRFNMRERHVRQRIVLEVDAPGALVRDRYGTWVEVDDLADDRCRVTIDADSFQWPTHIVANLDAPVTVINPTGVLAASAFGGETPPRRRTGGPLTGSIPRTDARGIGSDERLPSQPGFP